MARGMFDQTDQSPDDAASDPAQASAQMPDIGEKASWDQLHQHTQQVVRAANQMSAKFKAIFNP